MDKIIYTGLVALFLEALKYLFFYFVFSIFLFNIWNNDLVNIFDLKPIVIEQSRSLLILCLLLGTIIKQ